MEKPNKYANAKIYRIDLPYDKGTYVGSTCQLRLCMRKSSHVRDSRDVKRASYPLYAAINLLPDRWEGVSLHLIEAFPCNNKDELLAREGEWVKKLRNLNKQLPRRTLKEWRTDNREDLLCKKKMYYEGQKDQINEQKRTYNRENKAEIAAKRKLYRDANKDKIAAQKSAFASQPATCEFCQMTMRRSSLNNHIKRQHAST
jgi:hypothetical protein